MQKTHNRKSPPPEIGEVQITLNQKLKKLPRSFYLRPTLTVAIDLLGKHLVRQHQGILLVGRIVETEAYRGSQDPASHAYRGRTMRNEVMFWEGGHLYVYFTYGMHFCANIVTGEAGTGEAVLIRAVEPLQGIEMMEVNRKAKFPKKGSTSSPHVGLTNGPAKLCEALSIRGEQNGTDLLGDEIYLSDARALPRSSVGRSTRIGIVNGKEMKWRFYIKGNDWVSR